MARRISALDKVTVGISRDIGSSYDNVKVVAENIDAILATSDYAAEAVAKAAEAQAAYDLFDDRFLGTKASAPVVDNDGDPLQQGALYYDSTELQLKIYNGTSWEVLGKTRFTSSPTAPTNPPPEPGDEWLDTTNEILYRYLSDGTNTAWVSLVKSERLFVGSI